MSTPLRVALVGAGSMGSLHARVLSQSLSAELTLVVEPDESRGAAVAEQWGSKWVPGLDDFDDVDAVVVATPSHAHHEWALRSLRAGKPTLVEKPLSEHLADTLEMIEEAERLDVPIMCGLLERFNPAIKTMQGIVAEPLHMNVLRHSPHTPRIATDVAFDLAVHDIDLVLRLADQVPTRVTAHLARCHPSSPVGSSDIAEVTMSFADGVVASVSSSRVSQRKLRMLYVSELERLIEVDLLRRDITVFHHVTADFLDGRSTGYRQQTVIDIPEIADSREPLAAQLDYFVDLAAAKVDHDAERRTILPPHLVLEQVMEASGARRT
jgi:predicted dehydrogenase